MHTVINIHEAGKPMVKATALDTPTGPSVQRLGFMEGQIKVPSDFDQMGSKEIEQLSSLKNI